MKLLITPLERLILEALQSKKEQIPLIQEETGLPIELIQNILRNLILKGFVIYEPDSYLINFENKFFLDLLKNKDNLFSECDELIKVCLLKELEIRSKDFFRLRKSSLTSHQSLLLKAMLHNIDSFLNDCDKENKAMPLKEKTLIFWGKNQYQDTYTRLIENL